MATSGQLGGGSLPVVDPREPKKVEIHASPSTKTNRTKGTKSRDHASHNHQRDLQGMQGYGWPPPPPVMPPMVLGMPPINPMMPGMPGMPPAPGLMSGMPGMMPGMMPPYGYMDPGMMGMPLYPPPMYGGMPPPHMSGMGYGAIQRPMGPARGGMELDDGGERKKRPRRRKAKSGGKEKEDDDDSQDEADASGEQSDQLKKLLASPTESALTLNDILDPIVELATDERGHDLLKKCLDKPSSAVEMQSAFDALAPHTKRLSRDQYGTSVIQKLFDVGTAEQRKVLGERLKGEVVKLSLDQHGCRVIQKAFHALILDSQAMLAAELNVGDKVLMECIENKHGNHVIQKCIEQMPPASLNFVIEAVENNVDTMALHMYGCRIIQRLLEHVNPQSLINISTQILTKTHDLSKHQYGNFVIRHMLEHSRLEDKKAILNVIAGDIQTLAKYKCSSNVVEKCFETACTGEVESFREERRMLFFYVLDKRGQNISHVLRDLTPDKYGNYIVQRMNEYSRDTEKESLKEQLHILVPQLQEHGQAKQICSSLLKEFGAPAEEK
jgi:hypothetical protein